MNGVGVDSVQAHRRHRSAVVGVENRGPSGCRGTPMDRYSIGHDKEDFLLFLGPAIGCLLAVTPPRSLAFLLPSMGGCVLIHAPGTAHRPE